MGGDATKYESISFIFYVCVCFIILGKSCEGEKKSTGNIGERDKKYYVVFLEFQSHRELK